MPNAEFKSWELHPCLPPGGRDPSPWAINCRLLECACAGSWNGGESLDLNLPLREDAGSPKWQLKRCAKHPPWEWSLILHHICQVSFYHVSEHNCIHRFQEAENFGARALISQPPIANHRLENSVCSSYKLLRLHAQNIRQTQRSWEKFFSNTGRGLK